MVWSAGTKLHAGVGLDAVHPVALAIALMTLAAKEILFSLHALIGERLKSSMLIAQCLARPAPTLPRRWWWPSHRRQPDGLPQHGRGSRHHRRLHDRQAGWNFSVDAFHGLTDHALDPRRSTASARRSTPSTGVRDLHELRTPVGMGDWAGD